MKRWTLFKPLFAFFLISAMSACEKSGDDTFASVPMVEVSCEQSFCNGSLSLSRALVYFSKSGCSNDFEITASASPEIQCEAGGCSGTATSWVNEEGGVVTQLNTGQYDLCVLFDVDSSGNIEPSTGDITYSGQVSVDSGGLISTDPSGWELVN